MTTGYAVTATSAWARVPISPPPTRCARKSRPHQVPRRIRRGYQADTGTVTSFN